MPNPQHLALAPLAYFAARGELIALDSAISTALEAGFTPSQIQEVFLHQYAYAGFPRAINALNTLDQVLANQGIALPTPQGKAYDPQVDYYQLGEQVFPTLFKVPVPTYLQNFAGIDAALKAHLFGYLFSRQEILPALERELITVSTLAALENVQPQLRGHLFAVKNLGYSQEQSLAYFRSLASINPKVATQAKELIQQVYAEAA
ncbi:hypothetical protein CJP74_02090 [Psittacicella melopsittaci]|uniref:Carboxymuconolactone decarboxylase-like domain-containing protein n=1 Tax=Psittacicella melopsittaci TaxID=2028576 RepID=A0A3A1Y7Q5_9GAMM|nr:carboxymuconolactone decarboxylase family protein [Psittacicella melopsittaci]RIY33346.1 hypothetical protein CJP74_02090 [Psittacicella melopsittaci]